MASNKALGPFLWVNKDTKSQSSPHSSDISASINSHAQRWRSRQVRQEKQRVLWQKATAARKILEAGSMTRQEVVSYNRPTSPKVKVEAGKHPHENLRLLRPIIGKGQAADPFDCTAMRLDSDMFQLIHFYLNSTNHQDVSADILNLKVSGNPGTCGPATIVSGALSDELHMFSLLAYVATSGVMDDTRSGGIGSPRSAYFVQKALAHLQKRLRSTRTGDFELLHAAALLGGTAIHRNEFDAAKVHRRATKYLVESMGGFQSLPPHLVGPILGLDLSLSVSTLRQPLFDFTGPEYQTFRPPSPWTANNTLKFIGIASQNTASVLTMDKRLRMFLRDLIRIGQVLECAYKDPESSMNAFWVSPKCATMILNLLSTIGERGDDKLLHKGTQAVGHLSLAVDQYKFKPQDLRLEVSRMTLLMWAMWVGAIPLSRSADTKIAASFRDYVRFIPKFDASLLSKYKATEYGILRTAIEEWNRTLNILAQQRTADEDWVFSRLFSVIRTMEAAGDVQLGEYMTQLRQNVNSKAQKENEEEAFSTIRLNESLVRFVPAATATSPDCSTMEASGRADIGRPHLRNPCQLGGKQGKGIGGKECNNCRRFVLS
jgi:hypothetical protein